MNIAKCNCGSAENHNRRDNKYIRAINNSPNKRYDIFEDRTPLNESWKNPEYEGMTLNQLLNKIRKEYKEQTGQKLPEKDRIRRVKDPKTNKIVEKTVSGCAPIREGVCPVKPDTKIEDFKPLIDWFAKRHVKVVRIDIHRDEGHIDPETNERIYNNHAHIIFDWMLHEPVEFVNPKTNKKQVQKAGTSVKLNKQDMSEMQTVLADALGMERGDPKEKTGAEHLSTIEFRLKKTVETLKKLEEKNAQLEKNNENVLEDFRSTYQSVQAIGFNNVLLFDGAVDTTKDIVKPTEKEWELRDKLEAAANQDTSKMTRGELEQDQKELIFLSYDVGKATSRLYSELEKIAGNIPKLSLSPTRQRKMLAREAELEQKVTDAQAEAQKAVEAAKKAQAAAVAAAQSEARRAKDAAARAEAEAKKRISAAQKREQAAAELEKQYADLYENLEQRVSEAKVEGQNEGRGIQQEQWMAWKRSTHDPIVAERNRLRKEVSDLGTQLSKTQQQLEESERDHYNQAVRTAKTLIRKWGPAAFEKADLDYDITTFESWQTAKKELKRELQNDMSGGIKMR